MTRIATLLHISDLHFTQNLTEKGRQHWVKMCGVKSHAFGKIDALSKKVDELRSIGKGPDIILATGDISTDGSEEALSTALEFIESDAVYRSTPKRLATKGLGASKTQRIVIPGNHDRYAGSWLPLQKPSALLEKVFGTPDKYPYAVGYRRAEAMSDPQEPAIIFFVFDSTASELASFTKSYTPWYRIARGRVEDAECGWLIEKSNEIAQKGQVQGLDGNLIPVNYGNTIRIAVLHHHPVDVPGKKPNDVLTLMENNKSFVNACYEAGVDLILFGHQHVAYRNLVHSAHHSQAHPIFFFCCPSTSEFSERDSGFYLIHFDTEGFNLSPYIWTGRSFYEDDPTAYSYQRSITVTKTAKA